jgi:UDP-2,3-diacylglucosamine pyrophosphatase LpxH
MPTKTVIISDVHLSNGSTNYSWFTNDSTLKGFLNDTAQRTDVKELVLLGDIFDLWLYPTNIAPWTTQQIIQKWSGPNSVVSALRGCADKLPDVFYINGNHDMGVTAADLALISPKIKFLTSEQYNATHAPTLHLEHGHLVDMFNAPDSSDDTINGLPFGYFITRLVATASNDNEIWKKLADTVKFHFEGISWQQHLMQQQRGQEGERLSFGPFTLLLDDWLDGLFEKFLRAAGKELIDAIIDLLIVYVNWSDSSFGPNSPIILPDGSTVTVGKVKDHYHTLLINWYKKLGNLPALRQSALASTDLAWRAEQLLPSGPARLVVMGHTHNGKSTFPAGGQYANSGCWISGKQATYVEIDPAASPKAVVKTYPGNMPLMVTMAAVSHAMMADSPARVEEAALVEEPLPPLQQKSSDPAE